MTDLLTTRQVQDLLKVERITVYRMLADGRLKGVKIGQQWRFPAAEVERLLGLAPAAPAQAPDAGFPTHCVQTIQDLFAEVSQLSALVVDMDGRPLTEISRPTRLYRLLVSTAAGAQLARSAWADFARQAADGAPGARLFSGPAGLQYAAAPICERSERSTPVALFLAGQFYWAPQGAPAEAARRLAPELRLPAAELQAAAHEVPLLDPAERARVESWPLSAARAVESILRERLAFIDRLQQINNLTQLS